MDKAKNVLICLAIAGIVLAFALGLTLLELSNTINRVRVLEQDIDALRQAVTDREGVAHLVTATAYSPRACETNSDPWETATQTRAKGGRTIAVSRDILNRYNLRGRQVYIPGLGHRIVEDVMHKRKKNSIDVFFEDTDEAKRFGVRDLVLIIPE